MERVFVYREEANLKLALSKYKDRYAQYQDIPSEFESRTLDQTSLRSGRYPVIKKPSNLDYYRNQDKVLKVNTYHGPFKAKLVDWEVEPYRGASRWGNPSDNAWDTV